MSNRVMKLAIWRVISIIIGIALNGLLTGSWHMALGIVLLNSIVLTIGQAIFESQWEKRFETGSKSLEQG